MEENLEKIQRQPNPREKANPLSAVTFSYIIPTLIQGFNRDLEISDLTKPLTAHQSNLLGNKLEDAWKCEEKRAYKLKTKPSLYRILLKVFGWDIIIFGIALITTESLKLVQPLALGQLLNFFTDDRTENYPTYWAYLNALAVVGCSLANVLIAYPYMLGLLHLGMKMRVACCSLIYRKILKLNKSALGQSTVGQVVNLLSNDVGRFDIAVMYIHDLWMGPLETVICTYLMYRQIGISAIIGVLFIVLIIPIQTILGNKISELRMKTALRTDERVRLMNEIISGIQVIKMYAWEKPFEKLVELTRRTEIQAIKSSSFTKGITLSFIMYVTRISIFTSIVAHVLFDNTITAEKVFVITSFYSLLLPIMTVFFPQGIAQCAEAKISLKRINNFLLYDETELAEKIRQFELENIEKIPFDLNRGLSDDSIKIESASARWDQSKTDNTLTNITFKVPKNKLLAIIGPVGSGKSSLLQVILGELSLNDGTINVDGEISYSSQEPWLFSGSIRQNILFGSPYNEERYNQVIEVCALKTDFQILPFADRTLIGDRGITLSGGQKARVNLARAIYKKADIYLLDDPLSAVDVRVGKELFEKCITNYLKEKTVVLVTHQLQYLKQLDHIIYLEDGYIKLEGSFKQLQNAEVDFIKVLIEDTTDNKKNDKKSDTETIEDNVNTSQTEDIETQKSPLENKETKSHGSINFSVYKNYFMSGGNCFVIFVFFFLFILTQILVSGADYFVTYWVNQQEEDNNSINSSSSISSFQLTSLIGDTNEDNNFWHFSIETSIYIYTVLIVLLVIIAITRTFTFFTVCLRAAVKLHNKMFESIIHATLRFFNTNNAGRILNRFSKDIGIIDEELPSTLMDCLQIGLNLIGSIIMIGVVNPLLMIPTVVMGIIFYFLRIFYIRTSRSLKRLEGVTRSPVYSHLSASLQGLTTIRAFKAEEILKKEFDKHQDLHSSAFYSFIVSARIFGYWLDLICVAYVAFIALSFLLMTKVNSSGNVGLAITQAISLTGMFQWFMKQTTSLENNMTSVERVLEYNSIEHERNIESNNKMLDKNWPQYGKIEFIKVFLSYFPNDEPVLKNLNFTIFPQEKIGIVGRTGAGKSSLINAIFRLIEPEGAIIIDGIDITTVKLSTLRSRISIIPQEPVLFSGTMRKNLDPFDEYSDSDLWLALEDVELKEVVSEFNLGLNSNMSEGGSNFSVGQRQLICLARAILRNNKILILDEATANVDPQTDNLIQETIRTKFAECTVLTIAHRLHTIIDSDRILVMDNGYIKQFGQPSELLEIKDGIFANMVRHAGEAVSEAFNKLTKDYSDRAKC